MIKDEDLKTASVELLQSVNNLEKREKLATAVEESVKILRDIDNSRDYLKDIVNEVKETLDISSSEFNNLVKAKYDAFKVETQSDKLKDSLSVVELLFKPKPETTDLG